MTAKPQKQGFLTKIAAAERPAGGWWCGPPVPANFAVLMAGMSGAKVILSDVHPMNYLKHQ
jgi:hypothetical protein